MLTAAALIVGLTVGFVFGWLVRDAAYRRLVHRNEDFGLGVPGEWANRQVDGGPPERH